MLSQIPIQFGKVRQPTLLITAVLSTTLPAHTAFSQDAGGLQAELSISQGVLASDTEDFRGRTELGFNLLSQTRNQTLSYDLNTAIEQIFNNGVTVELEQPRTSLAYTVENQQSILSAELFYRQTDTDTDNFNASLDDPDTLIFDDTGIREDTTFALGYEFGRDARFGGSIGLGAARIAYSDLTTGNRSDEDRLFGSVDLNFEIDPTFIATLGYNNFDLDREFGRDTENENLSVGANFSITPTLDARTSVGVTRVTNTLNGVSDTDEGFSYAINLTQARPLGEFRASLDSDLNENGRRTNALVGGTFETRRGVFDIDLGVIDTTNGETNPLLRLGYAQDLQQGQYSVDLDQTFGSTTEGEDTLNSRLRLALRQDLNSSARFGFSFTYQSTDVLGADEDVTRWEVGTSFNRSLTRDLALTARYSYALVEEDGLEQDQENSFFIGLETSVAWRP